MSSNVRVLHKSAIHECATRDKSCPNLGQQKISSVTATPKSSQADILALIPPIACIEDENKGYESDTEFEIDELDQEVPTEGIGQRSSPKSMFIYLTFFSRFSSPRDH